MEQLLLKVKHRLQFYHFRHCTYARISWKYRFLPTSKHKTILFMCDCGWTNSWMRKIKWKTRIRSLIRCSWRGHNFDEPTTIQVGEVYEEEGEWKSAIDEGLGEVIGSTRQCSRCYKVIDVLGESIERSSQD